MTNAFTDDRTNVSPDAALRAAGLELSPVTQQLYSNPRTLFWNNKANLFEQLRAYAATHGIHDTFASRDTLNGLLSTRDANDRAIADRLMTESIMRTAQEISRSDGGNLAETFRNAMLMPVQMMSPNTKTPAQQQIEEALDAAGPQHPVYKSMREQYAQLAARGNLDHPKLVSLRVTMADVRQNGFNDAVADNTIRVNIPERRAHYNINGVQGNSRAVIGGALRPDGSMKQTPIATGEVQSAILQPVWYIPPSIAESKGLMNPQLIANLRRQYEQAGGTGNTHSFVHTNGERYTIDFAKVDVPGVSPFSQPTSPSNPLGGIKLILGGRFGANSIRMHHTADGSSFGASQLSSGCIRVENVADIVAALSTDPHLGQRYGYANTRDLIQAAMTRGNNPDPDGRPQWARPEFAGMNIPIQRGINVRTTYNTVTWDAQNNRAIVHRDIYLRDKAADVPSRFAMPAVTIQHGAIVPVADNSRQAHMAAPRYTT